MVAGSGLVLPHEENDGEEETQLRWVGTPSVAGPSWMKFPLITSGMLGVQAVWTIEMSQASPYLIELGLSKSLMSLVFVAGPLSGLIMQPLIGIVADRSKSRFGRRRPFIVGGCVLSIVAMLLLGWAKNIAAFFLGGGTPHVTFSIIIAIFSVFLVDFSVNAVMAADRALLVDTLPPNEQEAGNAWAGRLAGFGSVAGFWIGNVDLLKVLPFLGSTQLQALSVLTSVVLVLTHSLTAYSVEERVLISDSRPPQSFLQTFRSISSTLLTLPPQIRTLCFVQFFAWIGWFPILFFTSVYVSDLYIHTSINNPNSRWAGADPNDPALYEEATRAGSRALFWNAVVSFVTAVVVPMLVAKTKHDGDEEEWESGGWLERMGVGESGRRWIGGWKGLSLGWIWVGSHALFAILMFLTLFVKTVAGANMIMGATGFCWAIAQWAPFSILGELILTDISSTSTSNSPSQPDSLPLRRRGRNRSNSTLRISGSQTNVNEEAEALMTTSDLYDDGLRTPVPRSPDRRFKSAEEETGRKNSGESGSGSEGEGGNRRLRGSDGEDEDEEDEDEEADDDLVEEEMGGKRKGQSTAEKAGVILGIHNVFVVIPQFLVTFLSSIIFYLLEPTRAVIHVPIPPNTTIIGSNSTTPLSNGTVSELGRLMLRQTVEAGKKTSDVDAVGFIFRFGGVSAMVACVLCWRMMRAKERLVERGGG